MRLGSHNFKREIAQLCRPYRCRWAVLRRSESSPRRVPVYTWLVRRRSTEPCKSLSSTALPPDLYQHSHLCTLYQSSHVRHLNTIPVYIPVTHKMNGCGRALSVCRHLFNRLIFYGRRMLGWVHKVLQDKFWNCCTENFTEWPSFVT